MRALFLFFTISLMCSCMEDRTKLFTRMSAGETGLDFKNTLIETEAFNVLNYGYFYNGGGIAVGDINNDGLQDIYLSGNLVASKLYLNLGNFQFKDITKSAGVSAQGLWNTGVTMADVNADGYLDIYLCRSAAAQSEKRRNQLYINNKDLTFTEKGKEYGLDNSGYSTQAAFFDYDQDGDLDMYQLNQSIQKFAGFSKLIPQYKNKTSKRLGDKLYRNDGGKFVDVTTQAGIRSTFLGFGLGVSITDVDNDGWLDIYIGNDYNEEDYLYVNQRNGTFKESLKEAMGHVSMFSMGTDGADVNNDLWSDLISLDMLPESSFRQKMALGPENYDKYKTLISSGFYHQTMRNMLQLNNGDGTFSEIGQLAGVSSTDWSWAPLIADLDNDGWKDLFITNGHGKNYLDMDFMVYAANHKLKSKKNDENKVFTELLKGMKAIEEPNYVYRNNQDLTFSKQNDNWGLNEAMMSNGAVYADLDNDGDNDLIVNNINEQIAVYRNNAESITNNNYLKIKLYGDNTNKFGIGAKVTIYAGDLSMMQELIPTRGFQSCVSNELVFGLGQKARVDSLIVVWPEGSIEKINNIEANKTISVLQENGDSSKERLVSKSKAFFSKAKSSIGFEHRENEFIDFKKYKMLPVGVSNSGPKMTKADVNQDGLIDVYIGGAKNRMGQLYIRLKNQGYDLKHTPTFQLDSISEDTDALFFDANGDGYPDLYVTSGGCDFSQSSRYLQDRLYINDGKKGFRKSIDALPEMRVSTSSVTAADIDQDGDLDLFVGGRLLIGDYPLAPRSFLLINDGKGNFEDRTQAFGEHLTTPGMLTDVQLEDMNGDGYPDLVTAGDWMPLQIYYNQEGSSFGEPQSLESGWWNVILTKDFDRDGDVDIVAGNFGSNNLYQPSENRPATLIYADFDGNSSIDPLFFHWIGGENHFAYSRDELIKQVVSFKKKFPDYYSFATTTAQSVLDDRDLQKADTLVAKTLKSTYYRNDGNQGFAKMPLPVEIQFSPIYALSTHDVNGDGHLDLIAAGNQSITRVSTGKYDACYGLLMLGDGNGNFEPVDKPQSGLNVRGDVRDIEVVPNGKDFQIIFTINNDRALVYDLKK